MALRQAIVSGALGLAGIMLVGGAEAQYPAYPSYGYQAPAAPPSWSYDPYTSGLGPCPQRRQGDPPCSWTVAPTFGQPSYWPPGPRTY